MVWHYQFKGISIDVNGEDYRLLLLSGQMRYKPRNFWLLYQPEIDRAVSLVDKTKDGKYLLNPAHVSYNDSWKINYGDIPELNKLTKDKLNALWGHPINTKSNVSTYALSTRPPVWYTFVKVTPKADYFIDAKFKNGYLKAYRLRYVDQFDKLIHDWTNVNQ